jgi:uncharacterized protein YndB with AHSA1/START domain
MKTTNPKWSKFKLRINIKTDVDTAYNAWTTPGGLESWFLRNAGFKNQLGHIVARESQIQKGDTYEWFWHGYPDSVSEQGTVLGANGKNLFEFTFSMKCPVTVSIYEEAGETIVELVESNLPTDEATIERHYVGDSRGWIFYLTNLKSVLEGGLDLRNRNEELTNVITS